MATKPEQTKADNMNSDQIQADPVDLNDEEQFRRWSQNQYTRLVKYCDKHAIPVARVQQRKSRVLPPLVAIWNVKLNTKPASEKWVITGEVSSDHIPGEVASTAREALRHFSLSWQMKAATLERNMSQAHLLPDPEQQSRVINNLIQDAEKIYELYDANQLWQPNSDS